MANILIKFLVLSLVCGVAVSQSWRKNESRTRQRVRDGIEETTKRRTTPVPLDDDESTDECPEPNGYFADADQCDKYYACRDGAISEKLCPDGMVFNDYDIEVEKCDLPFNIDCTKRPLYQVPIPSMHCPRKNGYFGHSDKSICDKFYYCVDGMFNAITCPSGLVFNPKTGICTWPDEAQKVGCGSADVFKFTCPKVNESVAVAHPRYTDPDDCQYFFVCINGDVPRRNGCKLGQVFNDKTKSCDWVRNVEECKDFYKDRLTDVELEELENPKPKVKPTKGPNSARRPSRPTRPTRREKELEVEAEEDEEE